MQQSFLIGYRLISRSGSSLDTRMCSCRITGQGRCGHILDRERSRPLSYCELAYLPTIASAHKTGNVYFVNGWIRTPQPHDRILDICIYTVQPASLFRSGLRYGYTTCPYQYLPHPPRPHPHREQLVFWLERPYPPVVSLQSLALDSSSFSLAWARMLMWILL